MKTLAIINGVTGAIGAACLARFAREGATVVGLSRQAPPASSFAQGGFLPDSTLICSMGDSTSKADCEAFAGLLNGALYDRLVYIHAVGVYPFEINEKGQVVVSNDNDGDGIDDRVVKLSHDAFFAMSDALAQLSRPLCSLLFGGIADKFHPAVHTSWWTVIERVKEAMQNRAAYNNATYRLLNISSVICPHEILTRPYVFMRTNADPRFWLMPHEVADEAAALTLSESITKVIEKDLFHASDYYHADYFADEHFTERKMAELGHTQ